MEPITFLEPSYALMDEELNAVCTTRWGNLAIFSTLAVAEQMAAQTGLRRVRIVAVTIRPVVS